jgi:hypothetical protein
MKLTKEDFDLVQSEYLINRKLFRINLILWFCLLPIIPLMKSSGAKYSLIDKTSYLNALLYLTPIVATIIIFAYFIILFKIKADFNSQEKIIFEGNLIKKLNRTFMDKQYFIIKNADKNVKVPVERSIYNAFQENAILKLEITPKAKYLLNISEL